jgi:pyruvate,water dikinase
MTPLLMQYSPAEGERMSPWWRKRNRESASPEQTIRSKYATFRELLSLNNDCLELLAGIQEDLQYAPASRRVLGTRVADSFHKVASVVEMLERLTGSQVPRLSAAVEQEQNEVESYVAARDELARPPLALWLSEIDLRREAEVGGKAAALGEIKNRLSLPVPEGYVVTAEAYREFCGITLWKQFRDAARNLDLNDLDGLEVVSGRLAQWVKTQSLPRAVEVAIGERARSLAAGGTTLAVRSSAVGEGGERTFAGQFVSLLNVPPEDVVVAYRSVVAGRFGARALFYRLSAGMQEVESPMAVLCLRMIPARASGIMYTRDPKNPRSDTLWITATHGLGVDLASGAAPADLFVISRKRSHSVLEQTLQQKEEQVVAREGGNIQRLTVPAALRNAPALSTAQLQTLAEWALLLEDHFACPQDVEWALDAKGELWIVQSRPLALADTAAIRARSRIRGAPLISGGKTVYPGRVSGLAHLAADSKGLHETPQGAIVFLRKASPEIIEIFPRISGLVAEWGNLTGHAAALLREFKIPSVFQLPGAFEHLHEGDMVSLDAVQPRIFAGSAWPGRNFDAPASPSRHGEQEADPIHARLLNLHLLDPSAFNFRPSGCKSAHDVLRFCHEKAIEAMFTLNDREIAQGEEHPKRLLTPAPINMHVLDLGGGLVSSGLNEEEVTPAQIVCRPFQALWRGVTHPGVSWTRAMPASFGDLASVMTTSFATSSGAIRALGEASYLLVADEYMNLNSRLAYHFTLVDACVSEIPSNNYVAFRFAGGGAARERRNLRACFIEACLVHYGFHVDRRGDLVNAWFKKAPGAEMETNLDILGRLMACTSQLDMYMTSNSVMQWYVQQFLGGNYSFELPERAAETVEATAR